MSATSVPASLAATAVQVAASQLGVHEEGGSNMGPEVNLYLAAVGLDPGYAWCSAMMYWVFREAARRLGLENPFPKTASALHVWGRAEPLCRDSNPQAGYVYVLQHSATTGHVGIVESVVNGVITELSGNTNTAGSREGNAVARHVGQPEVTHGGTLLGYLDFDRAAQLPPGFVA